MREFLITFRTLAQGATLTSEQCLKLDGLTRSSLQKARDLQLADLKRQHPDLVITSQPCITFIIELEPE